MAVNIPRLFYLYAIFLFLVLWYNVDKLEFTFLTNIKLFIYNAIILFSLL